MNFEKLIQYCQSRVNSDVSEICEELTLKELDGNKRISLAGIMLEIGMDQYIPIASKLSETPAGNSVLISLLSLGDRIYPGSLEYQHGIEHAFVKGLLDKDEASLLSGVGYSPKWKREGFESEPSKDQIELAWNEALIRNQSEMMAQVFSEAWNRHVAGSIIGTVSIESVSDVRDAVNGLRNMISELEEIY